MSEFNTLGGHHSGAFWQQKENIVNAHSHKLVHVFKVRRLEGPNRCCVRRIHSLRSLLESDAMEYRTEDNAKEIREPMQQQQQQHWTSYSPSSPPPHAFCVVFVWRSCSRPSKPRYALARVFSLPPFSFSRHDRLFLCLCLCIVLLLLFTFYAYFYCIGNVPRVVAIS